jgi:hypothetical protein
LPIFTSEEGCELSRERPLEGPRVSCETVEEEADVGPTDGQIRTPRAERPGEGSDKTLRIGGQCSTCRSAGRRHVADDRFPENLHLTFVTQAAFHYALLRLSK